MGCARPRSFVGLTSDWATIGVVIMRIGNICWGVCATLLVANAVQADERFGVLDDSPRFMLYVHKELGSARHKSTGPSFGFAVDRASNARARIFDLRVAPFDHGAIMLNGFRLTGQMQGLGYSGSYGEGGDSWGNPWLWAALGIGAAPGISCATDNWPCDDGSYGGDDDYQVPGT